MDSKLNLLSFAKTLALISNIAFPVGTQRKAPCFGDKFFTMCKNKYILWFGFVNRHVEDVFFLLSKLTLSSQGKQILAIPHDRKSEHDKCRFDAVGHMGLIH